MSQDRARATQRLAQIFQEHIAHLKMERHVPLKDVAGKLGERPFNIVMNGRANTLPYGLLKKATVALGLPQEERNDALSQIPIIAEPSRKWESRARRSTHSNRGGVRR